VRRYPELDSVRLRQLRLEQALTQRALSQMTGVSEDAISRLENGLRHAKPSTIRRLAQGLGVEPRELMTTEDGNA
jgi:transcriptional regulator with XRE-family HTH domain